MNVVDLVIDDATSQAQRHPRSSQRSITFVLCCSKHVQLIQYPQEFSQLKLCVAGIDVHIIAERTPVSSV